MVVIEKNILPKNCILAIRSLLSHLDYELGRSQNVKKIFEYTDIYETISKIYTLTDHVPVFRYDGDSLQ